MAGKSASSKKWVTVAIISIVFIIAEVVAFMLVTLPVMQTDKVYKELEAGKDPEKIYKKSFKGTKDMIIKKVDDFGTYHVNKFLNGEEKYYDVREMFSNAAYLDDDMSEAIEPYSDKLDTEYLIVIYNSVANNVIDGKSVYADDMDEFNDVYRNMYDKSVADKALNELVQSKYDSYLADEIDVDTMDAYASAGVELFDIGTDEYKLASDISDDMALIKQYQGYYDTASAYYDDGKYFECMDECDDKLKSYFSGSDDTTGFKKKFESLRQDAYDKGKTSYIKEAENLANAGKRAEAKELLEKIDDVYGSDVDTTAAWELTREPWMTPYVEYMKNWDANLRNDLASGVVVGNNDPADFSYEDNKPVYAAFHDIDNNGTPELMLYTSDSSMFYLLTYSNGAVKYIGVLQIVAFCDGGVINECISIPSGYTQAYEHLELKGDTWETTEYFYAATGKFYVNGHDATYEEYTTIFNKFVEYDENDTVAFRYTNIDDTEDFIYNYDSSYSK